jgi:hypothetical protein
VVTAPGASAHAFVNPGDAPARQFIRILPGLDAGAFVLGLGEEVTRGGVPDPAALNAFGPRWQVERLGAPPRLEA